MVLYASDVGTVEYQPHKVSLSYIIFKRGVLA
jgi:hypothetical protein